MICKSIIITNEGETITKKSMILAVSLLLSLSAYAVVAHAETLNAEPISFGNGLLSWEFDEESGTLTINGSGELKESEHGEYPWSDYTDSITSIEIVGTITAIGDSIFEDCTSLTSITIPETVTSIGDSVFGEDTVFYDSNGTTVLDPTAEDMAGATFQKIDGKWVKQITPADLGMVAIIIAILVIAIIPVIVIMRRNQTVPCANMTFLK